MFEEDWTFLDICAAERALDELVSTIVMYDLNSEAQERRRALLAIYPPEKSADIERLAFRSRVTDPVRMALREGVRKIGADIHRLAGGRDGMIDSYHSVSDLDSDHAGRREVIINSAWNGVGSGDDRWWS